MRSNINLRKMARRSALIAAAFLLFQLHLGAQNIAGEIDGTVTDSSGAAVAGATVTIVSSDTHQPVRTVVTNDHGSYSAPLLQVGSYSVQAGAPGYRDAQQTGIYLNVSDTLTINLQLKVGKAEDSVTVVANADAPNTETAERSTVIGETEMKELALNTRSFEQMLILQPGVSYGGPDELYPGIVSPSGGTNPNQLSIDGLRPTQLTWQMDGSDMLAHGGMGLAQVTTFPSVDSIQEIKIVHDSYGAQYGGGGSAQVLLVTKAGGSSYHGDTYYFWRSKYLNATPFFDKIANPPQANPPIRYNDFGYTFGGPARFLITRDGKLEAPRVPKTYFFVSQEFRRNTFYPLDNQSNYPAVAQANGYFMSAVPHSVFLDPSGPNASQYAGYNYQIPATSFDPVAQGYLKDIINPALKISPPNSTTSAQGLSLQQRSPYSETQTLARFDHQFSERLSAFVRYVIDPISATVPNSLYTTGNFPGVSTSSIYSYGESLTAHGTWVATPTMILDFGFTFAPNEVKATPVGNILSANSPDINVTLPFPTALGRVPGLSINGGSWTARGPYRDLTDVLQWFENTTKAVHQHTLSFGVNIEHLYEWVNAGETNAGSFSFTGSFETAFANFLTGNPTSFTQSSSDGIAYPGQNLFEGYIQDNWRLSSRLTLNLGARYSIYGQYYDRGGHLGAFQPEAYNAALAPAIGTSGTICFYTNDAGCSNSTPNPSYNILNGIVQASGNGSPYGPFVSSTPLINIAPRAGFAWNVRKNGGTSLRAGYGIFYNQAPLSSSHTLIDGNPAYVQNPVFNTQPISFSNPSGGRANLNAVQTIGGQARIQEQPYTQGWSLDLQQEIGRRTLMDIGYVGNATQHLQGEEDLNQPLPGVYLTAGIAGPVKSGTTTAKLNQIRPYLGYGAIEFNSNRFFADYNGLQASLQRRFANHSLLAVTYTYSKAMTNSQGTTTDPQNRYDLHSEWGPATFDRRQMFRAHFVYSLPFFRYQKGLTGKVLGGWELSGIVQAIGGALDTVTQSSSDPAGQGGLATGSNAQMRVDLVGNPNTGPHTVNQFFNTSAFALVPAGQARPGNEKPGCLRDPGYQQWNVDLFKNFEMADQMRFQVRAEAFNVFNHVNYQGVGTTFNNKNFGAVTSAHQNRTMQLGAKFYF